MGGWLAHHKLGVWLRAGLRDDTPVVNFPFITHTMCYLLGALPGNVRNELWKLASLIKRGGSDKKKE